MAKIPLLFLAALISLPCLADPAIVPLDVQALPPPESPVVIVVGAEPGTESTVRHNNGETIEEFRRQGRLYRIKVIPVDGKPYELLETPVRDAE